MSSTANRCRSGVRLNHGLVYQTALRPPRCRPECRHGAVRYFHPQHAPLPQPLMTISHWPPLAHGTSQSDAFAG